jgi:hypothetical protein
MIFLGVMLSNRTNALINLDKISHIVEHDNRERITVYFNDDGEVEITTSLAEFGQQIEAALYHHKMANQ